MWSKRGGLSTKYSSQGWSCRSPPPPAPTRGSSSVRIQRQTRSELGHHAAVEMASQVPCCSCCWCARGHVRQSLLSPPPPALLPAQSRRGCPQNSRRGDTCQEYAALPRRFTRAQQSLLLCGWWRGQGRVRGAPAPKAAALGAGLGSPYPWNHCHEEGGDSPALQSHIQSKQGSHQKEFPGDSFPWE